MMEEMIGVTMLGLALFEGFAGYSLINDLLSGMGLVIAYSVGLSVPFVGDAAARFSDLRALCRQLRFRSRLRRPRVAHLGEEMLAPGFGITQLACRLLHFRRGFEARKDLMFVGGFQHPPNIDAVRWFAGEVMPLLRANGASPHLHVIGSKAPQEVLELAGEDVTVHGFVPDIAPYMDGCRLSVAPLRYGAGVKGKVNLSMAHGQPVVATGCAVEGMHLVDGRDVLVGDDADAFATQVVRLYSDAALWQRLSDAGLENVRRHFSLDSARDAVRRVFFA